MFPEHSRLLNGYSAAVQRLFNRLRNLQQAAAVTTAHIKAKTHQAEHQLLEPLLRFRVQGHIAESL